MPTIRTPINRGRRTRISPEAIALFRQLRAALYGADAWWKIHNELYRELGAKPWNWPCVEAPDVKRNYEPRPEALALWRELEAKS